MTARVMVQRRIVELSERKPVGYQWDLTELVVAVYEVRTSGAVTESMFVATRRALRSLGAVRVV
jgi:hypothetical protein